MNTSLTLTLPIIVDLLYDVQEHYREWIEEGREEETWTKSLMQLYEHLGFDDFATREEISERLEAIIDKERKSIEKEQKGLLDELIKRRQEEERNNPFDQFRKKRDERIWPSKKWEEPKFKLDELPGMYHYGKLSHQGINIHINPYVKLEANTEEAVSKLSAFGNKLTGFLKPKREENILPDSYCTNVSFHAFKELPCLGCGGTALRCEVCAKSQCTCCAKGYHTWQELSKYDWVKMLPELLQHPMQCGFCKNPDAVAVHKGYICSECGFMTCSNCKNLPVKHGGPYALAR